MLLDQKNLFCEEKTIYNIIFLQDKGVNIRCGRSKRSIFNQVLGLLQMGGEDMQTYQELLHMFG